MNLPKLSRDLITGIALVALLAVTRIGHFGGIATPPDASLAVFFLLGLWVASARWLVVGLLAAAVVDALVAVALQAREEARERRDFTAADAIRDALTQAGEDGVAGAHRRCLHMA